MHKYLEHLIRMLVLKKIVSNQQNSIKIKYCVESVLKLDNINLIIEISRSNKALYSMLVYRFKNYYDKHIDYYNGY